jgi:hypothetical protein
MIRYKRLLINPAPVIYGKPGFPFLYTPRQFVGLHFLGTSTSMTCGVMKYLRVAKGAAKYFWPGQELYYLETDVFELQEAGDLKSPAS